HMGFVEELKKEWKTLPPDEKEKIKQALEEYAKQKGVKLNFGEEGSSSQQQSPKLSKSNGKLSAKSLEPMGIGSDEEWQRYYEWWATMPLDFDVEAWAEVVAKGAVRQIGKFKHKERTPIFKEVFRTFTIPPGDPNSLLYATVGAVFFVKYAIDIYFINVSQFLKDVQEELFKECKFGDDMGLSCCIGRKHGDVPHGFDFSCSSHQEPAVCTLGIGNFCLHFIRGLHLRGGGCGAHPDSDCICAGLKIANFGFHAGFCLAPLKSVAIPKVPDIRKTIYLVRNAPKIVRELIAENTMVAGQVGAMVGAVGYIQWKGGNGCFSSFKLEDVIFETEVPISHVDESIEGGGGAPLFTPLSPPFTPAPQKISLAPIINPNVLFDFNISLRDVLCNIGISYDGKVISLCDALGNIRACTLINSSFLSHLCAHPRFSEFMLEFSLSDLLKRIKLSDLFGSSGVSFGLKISKGMLGRVSLCDIFNRIFKEAKLLEEDEDVCEIISEQSGRSLFDLLNFDVCAILPVLCGKKDLVELVQGLDLKNIRFPGGEKLGVKLTMGEILDRLSNLINVKLPNFGAMQSNDLGDSSRTLTVMGIPIMMRVKITMQYRLGVEGMGNPKRGFWVIGGAHGGGGYIGAVPAREFVHLLKAKLIDPTTGKEFPSQVTFWNYTMAWDNFIAAFLLPTTQSIIGALSVLSRCDEWTEFLKSRLIVGGGLSPSEAVGIKEAYFNEQYYALSGMNYSHPLATDLLEILPIYHESYDEVLPTSILGDNPFNNPGRVIEIYTPNNQNPVTKVCFQAYITSVAEYADEITDEGLQNVSGLMTCEEYLEGKTNQDNCLPKCSCSFCGKFSEEEQAVVKCKDDNDNRTKLCAVWLQEAREAIKNASENIHGYF
ncbi:MAG: hypothetical protein ACO2PO_15100, partial [Candidatus Calescibacterium sp.]